MVQDETADGLRGGDRAATAAMQASAQSTKQGLATRQGQGQGLGPQARKRIGTHLRTLYDSVLQQPVPDRFAALIASLDDAVPPAETGQ